jgi:serine/threonine protein kinase
MELLDGRSLRDILAGVPLPPRKAIDYGAQIAWLAAAHSRGVVHRDLKPENVFIERDGRAKILDVALAKPAAWLRPPATEQSPRPTHRRDLVVPVFSAPAR